MDVAAHQAVNWFSYRKIAIWVEIQVDFLVEMPWEKKMKTFFSMNMR